jgi:hypothetical protein
VELPCKNIVLKIARLMHVHCVDKAFSYVLICCLFVNPCVRALKYAPTWEVNNWLDESILEEKNNE